MEKTNVHHYLFVMVAGFFFMLSMAGFASGANVDVYKELGKVSDHRFYYPEGIEIGPDGEIYVADYYNHAVKAFKETGENVFSIGGESGDAVGKFNSPTGVARDNEGNIWVVDYNNHRLQEFTGSGGYMDNLGSNGNAWNFRFDSPEDVARGADGNYWIADYNNDRVVVLSPQGKQINIIGTLENSADEGQVNGPVSLDFDSEGFLWVIDHLNDRLQKYDSSGEYKAKIGSYGNSYNARLDYTYFVRVVSDGVLVSHAHNVTKFDLDGLVVFTLGKADGISGSGDGEFNNPRGIAVDGNGNFYVADMSNNRIQKFSSAGIVDSAFPLNIYQHYKGGSSTSWETGEIYSPHDIEIDGNNLWILDSVYDVVQKFSTGGVYEAGSAFDGSSDTTGGKLNNPKGLSIDAQGDLWISDDGNKRVREFSSTGAYKSTVSAITIDGVDSTLGSNVRDIIVNGTDLWVADYTNNRILKINTPDNKAVAFPGFNLPCGLDKDSSGNLWIGDTSNRRVVQMDTNGLVMRAFSEDSSYDQNLDSPTGIVADESAGLWVVDRDNNRVLRYTTTGALTHKIGGYYSEILQNPRGIAIGADGSLWVTDYDADAVLHFSSSGVYLGRIDNSTQSDVILDGPSGIALYYTDTSSDGQWDVGEDEFVVVSGVGNDQVVKFKTDGTYVANLGETGYGSGLNKYNDPWGLRIFGQEVFVADCYNDRVKVLSLDGSYKRAYTTDGGAWGKFDNPVGIAVNKTSGSLWVTDRDNDRLHEIKKNTEDTWEFVRTIGGPNNGLFKKPHNIYVDVSGNVWVSDLDTDVVAELDEEGNLLKILGDAQQAGGSFNKPGFVLGMSDGSMWVTDTFNDRVVHLDSTGNLLTLIGGTGGDEGLFENPEGIAVSGSDVYVADTINDRIQKFSSTGDFQSVIVSAGSPAGFVDDPAGMVFDSQDRLWVVERGNNRIQVFNSTGETQFTVGSSTLNTPFGIAIDPAGNVWVTDTGYNRVHKFTPDSTGTILLTIGKEDKTSGTGVGEFNQPYGVAVDSAGLIHVVDSDNNRVQVFDTDGNFQYAYGGLSDPRGLSIVNGKVYVADTNNGRVVVFNENGALLSEVSDNGATETGFYNPRGISMDSTGNLWVADSGNDRVVKIDSSGKVIKKVTQLLDEPIGVQVDSSDNVWVASNNNSRLIKYDSSGKLLKIFDTAGEVFDKLYNPMDMVFHQGNLYIVDRNNDRIVVQDGNGNTLYTFGVQGNEPGLINDPWGITVGTDNNIWVSQTTGGDKITAFTPDGEFVKVIGSKGIVPGTFIQPHGITFDTQGNLWVTDYSNHRIQKFSIEGDYLGSFGTYGNEDGQLNLPYDVAVDGDGNLWVADNSRLQKFSPGGSFLGKIDENISPRHLLIDGDGNIWATCNSGQIRKFAPDMTQLMNYNYTTSGSELGKLKSPQGIIVDANDHLWVAESGNNRLQRIKFVQLSLYLSSPKKVIKDEGQVSAYALYQVTDEIKPEENVSTVATWLVADNTLASVVKGLVKALETGKTTITAQLGGYEDSLVLDLLKFYGVEVTGNIDMENASPLILGKSVEGTINYGEKDFFEFTSAQAGYYRVIFSSALAESGATLNILNAAGDIIYSKAISGGAIAIPVYLDAQDYYIRMDGGSGSDNENYLVACLLTVAGEKSQAILLQIPASESGTLVIDSPAYYLLDLQGPRQLKISYNTESTMADVKITVYPEEISADTVLDRLISTDGEDLENNIGLAQGKYYLEVRTTAPGDTGYYSSYGDIDDLPYTLSVQPAVFETAGEYETNNTFVFANSIDDGVFVTARNFSNQDKDYYTFHYSPDSDTDYLVFNFTPQDTEGSHTIKLLNLEEDLLASYSAVQGNGVVDQKINLKPGQYYLQVQDQYSNRTEYLFAINGKISAVKKVTGINLVLGKEEAAIQVGDTVPLTAQVFYSDGSMEEDPGSLDENYDGVKLSSTDSDVLSVTAGQVEVFKAGSASIIATYEGKVAALDLSVGVVKKQNYGNLIVVAGGGIDPGNKLKDTTQYLCDLTYLKFKGRGFEDDDIYYFNPESFKDLDGNGFNDGIVDSTEVTNQNFASAITTWAKDYPSTGPLYIYLNDHGANAQFQLYPGQILTGAAFNVLLNTFQDTGRTVVVIIEACHSGTFVTPLQTENRVIITSSDEDVAYLGNGGSSSFSQFFMGDLYKGASLSEAFDVAIVELGNLGKPYDGMYPQKYPQDLAALDLYVVGDFALAPMFPEIAQITLADSYDIAQGGGYEIQAEVTGVTGGKVWATVKPADYAPPSVTEEFQTPDIQVPSVTLVDADAQGEMDGIFEGTGDFPCNGMYDVIIFARDVEGNITQSAINKVTVSGGEECTGEETDEIETGTGWSLLSSRISFNAADKFSDSAKFASVWKWESGGWAVYLPGGGTQTYADSKGFSVLSTISPGEGFWVNSITPETFFISGTPTTGSLTLTPGWNLVGLKSDQGVTVTTLISGSEANIASLWKWKDGGWAVYLPGEGDGGAAYAQSKGFSVLTNINPGEGFWVNATQQTTLD